jgi:hypothetical protein
MLFLLVPGDTGSGAVYVYYRCDGIWYSADFYDQNYGGYSLAELDVLLGRFYFLRLVENPRGLRRSEWFLAPGQVPQATLRFGALKSINRYRGMCPPSRRSDPCGDYPKILPRLA